ncbi:MAG TPA: T9SS type A sorting domain-containing protein [Chitinophagaceae bacterium]|jgi:hypothetical protein|nr:T9SS type A sorting domain-containing protein [Chitinophagaceae bacterium]
MKKILLSLGLIALFGVYAKLNAQCTVSNVGFEITNSTPVDATHCSVTFNLTFKIANNNGNKLVVIQAWLEADYPNYWNCNSSNQETGSHNAPKAADLRKNGTGPLPFINLAFQNDVTPPAALSSYRPDNSVPVITGYTGTRSAVDAQGFATITLTGVTAVVPAACGTGVSVRADLWSTNSGVSSSWPPQCVNCNNLFAFNYPQVTGLLDCNIPRSYQTSIKNINTNQTIVVSYQAYLDNPPLGTFGAEDALADDKSSLNQTLAPGQTYNSGFLTYTGNSTAPDVNKNMWIIVTTSGLPNTQNYLITNSCAPLPVRLTFFNAKRSSGSSVSLTWQTAQEINASGFEIQRQIGNGAWVVVGFVPTQAPNGNSSSLLNYSFNDNNNANAITQYRLREIDIDANSKFSEIRAVRGEGQAGRIIVYPNPSFAGKAKVVFEDVNGTRDISLIDVSGRMVKQWSSITNNNLEIDNLAPGYYSLRVVIRETGEQSIEKIVVNKR